MISKVVFVLLMSLVTIAGASEDFIANSQDRLADADQSAEASTDDGNAKVIVPFGMPEGYEQGKMRGNPFNGQIQINPEMTNGSLFEIPDSIKQRINDRNSLGIPGQKPKELIDVSPVPVTENIGIEGSFLNITGNVSILWEKHNAANETYAYDINDLDGDSLRDVLIATRSYSATSETQTISAVRGRDGTQLWTRSVSGARYYVSLSVSYYNDLTGDGLADMIITEYVRSGTTTTQSLTALRGHDGALLWTRSVSGDYASIGYSLANLTGDGLADMIISTSSTIGTTTTLSLTALRGYDGAQLWTRSLSGSLYNVSLYPSSYQDFTGDGLADVIIYQRSRSGTTESSSVTALRGYDGTQLWTRSISGTSISISGSVVGDMTGDGLADVIISTSSTTGATISLSLTAQRGYDGAQLWTRSLSGSLYNVSLYASSYKDITGDGLVDVTIRQWSRSGTTESSSVTALRGYDGTQLWTRSVSGTNAQIYGYAISDLTGDGLGDIIIDARSTSGTTTTESITALRGHDGLQLWTRSISGDSTSIWISDSRDLTGDGLTDVMISASTFTGTTVTSSVFVLRGYDGYQIFSKSVSGTDAYIYGNVVGNLTGDGLADVIIDEYVRSTTTQTERISALRGYDGLQLWTRSMSGSLYNISMGVSSYQDMTGDGLIDVIINEWSRTGTTIASSVTGLRGYDGAQLWTRSVSGTSAGISGYVIGDLTGDGLPDVLISASSTTGTTTTYSVTALRSYDGLQLWTRSLSGDYVYISASAAGNLTGDGLADVLIDATSRTGTITTETVTALRGYDGTQLWARSISGDYTSMYISNYRDLTGDGLIDVMLWTSSRTGTTYTYGLTGMRGYDGYQLWTRSLSGDNIGLSYAFLDWDGDGSQDVLVQQTVRRTVAPLITTTIEVMTGNDGSTWWKGQAESYMSYSFPDLNGDGKQDILLSLVDSVYALSYVHVAGKPTVSFNVSRLNLTLGSSKTLDLTLDRAPGGLSGYNISISLPNASVAELISVDFPIWATLKSNGTLPADTVWIKAADLNNQIGIGASNVTLATLRVRGDNAGTTNIVISITSMDDDSGAAIDPRTVPGQIVVISVVPFPGMSNPPTDPDGDGLFEDINGNGRKDFNDVVVFFNNLEWVPGNEPISSFDFNRNGRIDFNDIIKLFEEI